MKSFIFTLVSIFAAIASAQSGPGGGGAEFKMIINNDVRAYRIYGCDLTPNARYQVSMRNVYPGYKEEAPTYTETPLEISDAGANGCAEATLMLSGLSTKFGEREIIFRNAEDEFVRNITSTEEQNP